MREGGKDIYPSLGRPRSGPNNQIDLIWLAAYWPDRNNQVDLVWLENIDSADNKIYYEALN